MPTSCCVYACTNRHDKTKPVRFFRIPRDKHQRRAFVRAINRQDWYPTESSRVCSEHFVSGHISANPNDVDFAPTVFSYNVQEVIASQESLSEQTHRENIVQAHAHKEWKPPRSRETAPFMINMEDKCTCTEDTVTIKKEVIDNTVTGSTCTNDHQRLTELLCVSSSYVLPDNIQFCPEATVAIKKEDTDDTVTIKKEDTVTENAHTDDHQKLTESLCVSSSYIVPDNNIQFSDLPTFSEGPLQNLEGASTDLITSIDIGPRTCSSMEIVESCSRLKDIGCSPCILMEIPVVESCPKLKETDSFNLQQIGSKLFASGWTVCFSNDVLQIFIVKQPLVTVTCTISTDLKCEVQVLGQKLPEVHMLRKFLPQQCLYEELEKFLVSLNNIWKVCRGCTNPKLVQAVLTKEISCPDAVYEKLTESIRHTECRLLSTSGRCRQCRLLNSNLHSKFAKKKKRKNTSSLSVNIRFLSKEEAHERLKNVQRNLNMARVKITRLTRLTHKLQSAGMKIADNGNKDLNATLTLDSSSYQV